MLNLQNRNDAAAFARERLGFVPDAEQERLLATRERYVILNCHRQWGKSTMTAIRAVHRAVTQPKQQVVVVSTTMRLSMELAAKCREFGERLGLRLGTLAGNEGSVVFPNGSVIRPLPADANRLRGFTAHLLIVDEAARIPDEVYAAATPMLAATDGDMWLLSTPRGRKGFFYEEWKIGRAHV